MQQDKARPRARARVHDELKSNDAQKVRSIPTINHPSIEDHEAISEDDEPPTKKQAIMPLLVVPKNPPRHHSDDKEEKWDTNYRACKDFCTKFAGKLPYSRLVYDFEGQQLNLGNFINIMKMRHRGTNKRPPLNEEEKNKLGEIAAWTTWATKNPPREDAEEKEEKWEVMYQLVKNYEIKAKKENCRVPAVKIPKDKHRIP